ncbi:endoplasmic reticulum resident protein 29-like [Paramacrobiotus metropolitanus]|uniref:endoplasmic reticulum resident protein 29-like n=1 Tax=Paramacrobiotus metropolitanus TaxID=2943436 RepID=UPI002445C54F|nr:endoplasmic reticulum resident protein 29-like [Paramacrobiotus metropolitanus]
MDTCSKVTKFCWFACICFIAAGLTESKDAKGSVPLDGWTFDKILPLFKVALVKFDRVFPHGDKHDEYIKVAEAAHANPDLLLAEVNTADYGDKKNADLAERFNVNKDDFPVLKLFIRGTDDPIPYTGNFQADDIKRFLKSRGGVWVGLAACIEEFDELARLFTAEEDPGKREALLQEAESKAAEITDPATKNNAKIYLVTMKKILEKGKQFVAEEIRRVEKLQSEKIADKKKEDLKHRINILHSFKDEL